MCPGVPLVATNVVEYIVPATPFGRLVLAIESGAGAAAWTDRLSDRLAPSGVASESVTETVKLKVPLCDGVPASMPDVPKVKPAGRVPEARLHL
jgi:hypothetical protein